MSDFDERAGAAGKRARRLADEIATSIDPTATVGREAVGEGRRRALLLLPAAAVLVVAGVGGLVVLSARESSEVHNIDGVTTTDVAVTTSEPTTTTTESPTTTVSPPEPATITRPIIDPAICTPISAFDGDPSGLPRDPSSNLPVTLFTRGSDSPVPIQVIGDPVEGQAEPFAMVLRYYGRPADRMFQLDPVDINGTQTYVGTFDNGNGEAEWTLPDGSVGYLRSRGLDRDQLVAILGQLTPRPTDAPVNGFDYGDGGPDGLELVAERMNTEPWTGTITGSQCIVQSTGYVNRITMYTGEPTLMYAAVIDRTPPADVGVIGESVIILGAGDAGGLSASDVVDADEATWQRLLEAPGTDYPIAETFTVGEDIEVPFVPIDATSTPASSLTLRVVETDGVAFLEIYQSGAVIADAAEYWKLEIDQRIRSRSTATPGPGQGVAGTNLGAAPITAPFFVNISTTDGDDQTIQTTGLIQLVPIP